VKAKLNHIKINKNKLNEVSICVLPGLA